LHALAVTSAQRVKVLPEVPTVAASGVPGFEVMDTFGILAPIGTPAAVVQRLNTEIRNVLQLDDVKAKFAEQGLEAAGSTPAEWRAIMEADVAKWTRVIKDANIPPF
jgi:tripartite-type tricarboxylate transporter receptor subunit TctC